ncbi:unnamed protein product, partial [Didymodactylos carnosus]
FIYMIVFCNQNVAMSDVLTRTTASNDEQIFDLTDSTSSSLIYSGLKLHPKPLIPTISMPGIANPTSIVKKLTIPDAHIDGNKLSSTNCNSLSNLRQPTVHLTSNNNINNTSSSTSATHNSSSIRLVAQQKPLSSTPITSSQPVQLQILNKPIPNIVAMSPIIQTTSQLQQASTLSQTNKTVNGTNSGNTPPSSYPQFPKAFILNQQQPTMVAQTSSFLPKVHQQTFQSSSNSSSPPQTTTTIKHNNTITTLSSSILTPQSSSASLLTLGPPNSFSSSSSPPTNITVSTPNSLSSHVATVTPKIQTLNSILPTDLNGQTQQTQQQPIYLQSPHNTQFSDTNSKLSSNALQITVKSATSQLQSNTATAVMNNHIHSTHQSQPQSQQVFSLATKNKLTVVQPYMPTATTNFTTNNTKNIHTQSPSTTKLVIQQGNTIWPHAQSNLLNCTTVPKIYSIPHQSVMQAKVLSRPVQLIQTDHINKTSDVCFLHSARTTEIKSEKNDNGMSTSFQIAGMQMAVSSAENNFTPLNVQVPHFSKNQDSGPTYIQLSLLPSPSNDVTHQTFTTSNHFSIPQSINNSTHHQHRPVSSFNQNINANGLSSMDQQQMTFSNAASLLQNFPNAVSGTTTASFLSASPSILSTNTNQILINNPISQSVRHHSIDNNSITTPVIREVQLEEKTNESVMKTSTLSATTQSKPVVHKTSTSSSTSSGHPPNKGRPRLPLQPSTQQVSASPPTSTLSDVATSLGVSPNTISQTTSSNRTISRKHKLTDEDSLSGQPAAKIAHSDYREHYDSSSQTPTLSIMKKPRKQRYRTKWSLENSTPVTLIHQQSLEALPVNSSHPPGTTSIGVNCSLVNMNTAIKRSTKKKQSIIESTTTITIDKSTELNRRKVSRRLATVNTQTPLLQTTIKKKRSLQKHSSFTDKIQAIVTKVKQEPLTIEEHQMNTPKTSRQKSVDEIDDELLKRLSKDFVYFDQKTGIRWVGKKFRPHTNIITSRVTWKPRSNHFEKYTDITKTNPKRTVSMKSLQTVTKKLDSPDACWRIHCLTNYLTNLTCDEQETKKELSDIALSLNSLNITDKTIQNKIEDLLEANIQRHRCFCDQIGETKTILLSMLDHSKFVRDMLIRTKTKTSISSSSSTTVATTIRRKDR